MLNFVPLLEVIDGRVILKNQGLKIIEAQVLGQLHVVDLEGARTNLLYNFYRNNHVLGQF